ncbi:MAG: c-type cytochrome [Aestuariivirgaceae bacterium]|nr:c-type cytochrome [Aestuariivirgaceae bacterium]
MRHWMAVLGVLGLAGWAQAAETVTPPAPQGGLEIQLGLEDFRIYCATCHGTDAKGGGPVAEFMTMEPPDLTTLSRRAGGRFPAELITRVIDGRAQVKAHGPRDMPVWGDYFAAEKPGATRGVQEAEAEARIRALVAYIGSIQAR